MFNVNTIPNPDETNRCPIQDVARLKNKDQEAWTLVFNHYNERLGRNIFFYLAKRGLPFDEATVDDLRQQAWIIAAQKIDEFDAKDGVELIGAWLNAIGFNLVRNFGRTQRGDASFDDFGDDNDGFPSLDYIEFTHGLSEGSAEDSYIFQETLTDAINRLEELSPRDRAIFLGRYAFDEKPRELAAQYDMPAKTISQILTRAKRSITG